MNINDQTHHQRMEHFMLDDIPDLDECVLGALELFHKESLPKLRVSYKKPMVVGSGNAEATGRILFADRDAVFANESNYESKLQSIKGIDGVVLISASGEKHAPIIAKGARKLRKKVTLITTNPKASAKRYADKVYVFPRQKEPYTYNTSTYLGMILGHTGEDPQEIYDFITKQVAVLEFPKFRKYKKYFFILPNQFGVGIKRMLTVKFIELFGRNIARDVETFEYMKHAVTVVPSEELFVSFGERNGTWGDPAHRFFVPLPKNASYGAMMAISYYLVGKIQKKEPSWFDNNIVRYTTKISRIFKKNVSPIVSS